MVWEVKEEIHMIEIMGGGGGIMPQNGGEYRFYTHIND